MNKKIAILLSCSSLVAMTVACTKEEPVLPGGEPINKDEMAQPDVEACNTAEECERPQ